VHSDEKNTRKDSPEISDLTKEATVAVRLELMRFPNIRKLKTERLDTLARDILASLNAKGFLTIAPGDPGTSDEPEPAPERKLRAAKWTGTPRG
jgi:hypothetical protein